MCHHGMRYMNMATVSAALLRAPCFLFCCVLHAQSAPCTARTACSMHSPLCVLPALLAPCTVRSVYCPYCLLHAQSALCTALTACPMHSPVCVLPVVPAPCIICAACFMHNLIHVLHLQHAPYD